MITDWASGHDTDGAGKALAAEVIQQPRLWRLLKRIGVSSPGERLADACATLAGRYRIGARGGRVVG
jgi:exodeoxyribonuclease V gamma subunit